MYPNFYYLIQDVFGIEVYGLVFVNTFGFFVALAFLLANYVMKLELKRKQTEGFLTSMSTKQWFGKRAGIGDYISNAAIGFVFGWKFVYLFSNGQDFLEDAQSHILSLEGSVLYGTLVAALAVGIKYYEEQKMLKQFPAPVEKEVPIHPYQRMGTITIVAAIAGFFGAKIFDHMEHWDKFIENPIAAFFNPFSGLTFYGGLICGGIAVIWVAKRYGIHWKHMLDVGGPAMMLAYGIGRIGCHMSGDGDWGIVNLKANPGLPDWLWAYTYPNNVAKICDPYTQAGCMPGTIPELTAPVWPTAMYEAIVCIGLFFVLWGIRKRISVPGVLFSIYLFLAGVERFFIEKIRVNEVYHMFGMDITQAELISVGMMLGAGVLFWYSMKSVSSQTSTS